MTQPLLEVLADALAGRAAEALAGDRRLPAARLQPHGTLHFPADRTAAGG